MVTEVERLVVRLEATQRQFERQLAASARTANRRSQQIEQRFDRMNRNIQRGSEVSARAISQIAAPLAAGLSVRSIQQYADAWTVAANKIAAASQISGRQARGLSELNDIADETRSGIEETVDLYAKLLRATKDVANSEEEVARATEIVNKAFKAGGAAASEQAAGILQLAQGLSSGILQGDELRSLRENAPLVAQAIADEFNTTIGGLKELGAEGELTAGRVFRAILNAQSGIEAAFSETNATIGESFTRLRNSITEYVGTGGQAIGVSDKIASALQALAENLDLAVAAGTVLGARFIGPVLIAQLSRAIPVILGAATVMRGLGSTATATASGIRLVSGVLGLLGGPLGLLVTGFTAFNLLTDDTSDKIANLETAGNDAVTALEAYASASRRAADDQERLGGAVSAATQQILAQSRAQLQDSLKALREEYAELKSDLEDTSGFFGGASDVSQFATRLSGATGLDNQIGQDVAAALEQIGDGAGDVAAVSAELERLAGIGEVAAARVSEFDTALSNASSVDFAGARDALVDLARTIGGFSAEIEAIENAEGFTAQARAALELRNSLANSVEVASALRTEEGQRIREALSGLSDQQAAIQAVEAALAGNVEEAERLLISLDDSAGAASSVADAASNIAPQIGNAANEAARLAANLLTAARINTRPGQTNREADEDAAFAVPVVANSAQRQQRNTVSQSIAEFTAPAGRSGGRSSSGGGGGGVSDAQREAQRLDNEQKRVAERIIESLKTTTDEYNGSLNELRDAYEQGRVTTEQFNLAQANLNQEFLDAQFADSGLGSFIDQLSTAIANSEDLGDVFVDQLRRMSAQLISSGLTNLAQNIFGGLPGQSSGGGLLGTIGGALGFPSFNGGGFTGNGNRSGGVDGKGGFPAIIHPNEQVVDLNTARQSRGSSGQAININQTINAQGAQVGVADQIASAVQAMNKSLPDRIRQINNDPRFR